MKALALFGCALLAAATAHASGYIGIYAVIDKVVFEPSPDQPERVQVFGTFSVAKSVGPAVMQPPQRGYMYFSLPQNGGTLAQREWADLKAMAGTGQVVSFWAIGYSANDYKVMPTVRKASEKPANPDVYRTGSGATAVRSNTTFPAIQELL